MLILLFSASGKSKSRCDLLRDLRYGRDAGSVRVSSYSEPGSKPQMTDEFSASYFWVCHITLL